MLQDDMFVGGQFAWFTGIVEDVNDPEQMNRVKVRCLGWYGEKVDVPTADLPWATVLLPNTSASKSGVGSTHELMVDSWVVGFFRDGNSAQDPIVIGSISSTTEGVKDIPERAQGDNYPNNKVHVTEANHIVEYDNTPGSERIEITHKDNHTVRMIEEEVRIRHKDNHTFTMNVEEIELRHKSGTIINIAEDGTVLIDAVNDVVNIDGNTTITGTLFVSETTHSVGDISTDAGNAPTLATHVHKSISQDTGAGTNSGKKKDTTVADA